MIHFDVIQSPDTNARTTFHYHKNEVYLGSGPQDLMIEDPCLKSSHLMMEIQGNELLVHPQRDVSFYLINGKRTTTIRKVKAGDLISMGDTVIKILGFEMTDRPSKKELLDVKLAQLIDQGSLRLQVIEEVSKLMK